MVDNYYFYNFRNEAQVAYRSVISEVVFKKRYFLSSE